MSIITITVTDTATVTVNGTTVVTEGPATIVIEDGSIVPVENYFELEATASQTVFEFGVAITPSSTDTKRHQLFRNGKLEQEGFDYTITDAATGQVTTFLGIEAGELLQLYLV